MNGKKLLVIGGATVLTVGILGASTAFAHPKDGGEQARQAIVNTVAGVLEMEKQDLIAELKDGKTLAEVAQENGMDVDVVIEALVYAADERLDEAVESGKITEEEAAEKRVSVEERISALVDKVLPRGRDFGKMMRHRGGHSIINAASNELGMEKQELVEQLRGGSTISELATENGVSTEAIIDTVVSGAGKGLAKAVENGAITQEKADERLAMIEEKVTEAMGKAWPAGRGERGGRGHGPGFGRHNNPGMEAREGGQRYDGENNPGTSLRQSGGYSEGGPSDLLGFGGGRPQ